MATPQLKLSYFPFPGRAQPIRMAFVYGNVPFEDNHIQREDWMAFKQECPFGQMPVLEVCGEGGCVLAQTQAILRYAGKVSGLYPTDVVEQLFVDMMADHVADMSALFTATMFLPEEDKEAARATALEKFHAALVPFLALKKGAFMCGSQPTIVDFSFATMIGMIGFLEHTPAVGAVLADFPQLEALRVSVLTLPRVAEWLAAQQQ